MTKVLLTGGSGFIAAHILEQLLAGGHSVVTTVRSDDKANKIYEAYPGKKAEQLKVVIVPDIAKPDAFEEVVKTPGLEVVMHTASPFHFKITDPQTEMIDPAVVGTTGILKAIVKSAPTVRRVVITSSFAAILAEDKLKDPNTVFTENSWNPVTIDDIHRSAQTAYWASKTLAEKAAWDFVHDESNGARFDLVTVNPPMVYGPVVHYLASLDAINTSNQVFVQALRGGWKDKIPETDVTVTAINWVDVRDIAVAHIRAGLEIPDAAGRRLFTTAGFFCNRATAEILRKNFPEDADKLPGEETKGGELPPDESHYRFDNSETTKLLGIDWISLEKSVVDTVRSLKAKGL